jgi:hypothetical protein
MCCLYDRRHQPHLSANTKQANHRRVAPDTHRPSCVGPDLWPCGALVDVWVCGVLKLLQHVAAGCVGCNLLGLLYSTLHSLRWVCVCDKGTGAGSKDSGL